ncbi:MAG: riboflavin synthase [Planctomycetota bacterium]
MFTGLVRGVGVVRGVAETEAGGRLEIEPPPRLASPSVGDSIAIDGCCLTLAEPAGERWAFDAVPQTLGVTSLGRVEEGDRVNIEPSLKAGDELGGHIVQGHVDGLAEVISVKNRGEWRVRFRPPAELAPMIVPKGSVCLAGVSLTIAEVDASPSSSPSSRPEWFEVVLIPTTLAETNLEALVPGQAVNIETDVFARTIVHYLRHFSADAR